MTTSKHPLISIVNRSQCFECPSDQVILIGMERRGKKGIRVGCRGGGCGVCKVKILAGEYRSKKMSRAHISVEEEANGFALACRVYPLSDLQVEADHFVAAKSKHNTRSAADFVEQLKRKREAEQ